MNKALLGLIFLLWSSTSLLAQITSSGINGVVTDGSATMPGATIRVTHLPTGTNNGAVSLIDGSYSLLNLQPGGPYKISCSYVGYETLEINNIYLTLGKNERINLKLKTNSQNLSEVKIVYDKKDKFNNDNTGVSTQIGREQIEKLPSLNRSLQDMTRLTPQGSANSFGGNNYRYNHLSIDGVANNDAFGFQEPASGAGGSVASGTPGGLAKTQPISLDAIQEVQVVLAPYDVKLGNFTGANINAVTRSGTNEIEGSVYAFGRNQTVAGRSVDENRSKLEKFYDYQTGFRLGLPIVKNKLFAFVNYENSKRSEPVTFAPGDPASNIPLDVAKAIADTVKARYGFDVGTFGAVNINRNNDKVFARLDFYPKEGHQLTLRQNIVLAKADNLERTANILKFGSQAFVHNSNTYSTAFEWKARLNDKITNSLVLGYTLQKDKRTFEGTPTPHVDITYNTSNIIYLGTYREASIYGLDLKTYEVTDNLNIYKGKHTFTFGTHNELYSIKYNFLSAWNGRWEYRSLQDFYNERPNRIRGVYNNGDNSFENNQNTPSADFRVFLLSAYAQDEIKFTERLTATAGVRIDMQVLPDKIAPNPKVVNNPEFERYNNNYGGVPQINPRVGFNYALTEDRSLQLRGGSGLFTGRVPFSVYAYSHYNDGLKYSNVDIRPTGTQTLLTDVQDLKGLQSGLTEINLVDKNFKLPRSFRNSLAIDFKAPKGWIFTLEGIYSKTITDLTYYSVNQKDSLGTFKGPDNRPYYLAGGNAIKIEPSFTNVFVLGNTDKGFKYNVSLIVNKNFDFGLTMSHAYSYGRSKDIVNGVRVSPAANWEWTQTVDHRSPGLTYSNFDIRHRVVSQLGYTLQENKYNTTYVNAVFTTQSGSPFSYVYAGDLNRDGSSRNDVIYVPRNQNDIILKDYTNSAGTVVTAAQQWQQLDEFIANDKYLSERRGQYAERNGARTPWNTQLDIRFAHEINLNKEGKKRVISLTADIINFTNLLNRKWGWQTFVPNDVNSSYQLLDYKTLENGQPTFQYTAGNNKPYQVDQLSSRWQAQLGVRLSF